MRTRSAWWLLPLLLSGCETFKTRTPPGFVSLTTDEDYDYRATTADGVVAAVRVLDNEPRGDEAFWTDAIAGHLRQQGGYALLDSQAVRTRSGLAGRRLRFGHDEGTHPHLYQLTVFVTRARIYVVESGGAKPAIERESPHLEAFLGDFEARRCWWFTRPCAQPALD